MQSVCRYFDVSDSTRLGWVHGVNSKAELTKACADPAVHMVVGDVHFADQDALPCMAHAWQDIADMDVESWVVQAMGAGKGMKLDFADAAAVEPTLAVLQRLKPHVPVMLHANVFSLLPEGGAGESTDGLEPEQFVRLCQTYLPQAVLSLGWSLKREADSDGRMEEMLIHQMADMSLKRLGGVDYALEIRGGYTSGWERGAALIFDPLPTSTPANTGEGNVVQATHLFRRVAA